MRIRHVVIACSLVFIALAPATTSAQSLKPEMLAQFEQKTGLQPVEIPGTQGAYMGKMHRGYNVVFTAKAGNVWGRYAARLTMGEIGREVGGFAAYLTGQRGRIGESVVGSPLDRLLSQYLGQPVTLAIVLTHNKPNAPRLDVLSDRAKVSFFFAGSELEYSQLIRNHGDYFKMLNDLMENLADIADAIPSGR